MIKLKHVSFVLCMLFALCACQPPKNPISYSLSDKMVKRRIMIVLYKNGIIPYNPIEVRVSQGWVSLSGTAESRDIVDDAKLLAKEISGVKRVSTHIVVRPAALKSTTL